jgi:hypothetical protein
MTSGQLKWVLGTRKCRCFAWNKLEQSGADNGNDVRITWWETKWGSSPGILLNHIQSGPKWIHVLGTLPRDPHSTEWLIIMLTDD